MTERPLPPTKDAAPVSVVILNDHQLVVEGVAAMLAPFERHVTIAQLDVHEHPRVPVDIALYDDFSVPDAATRLGALTGPGRAAKAVLYTWRLSRADVAQALDGGAAGVLSKALPAGDLVTALRRIHAGHVVVSPEPATAAPLPHGDWPGRAEGLTAREAEVVALITQGLSNADIAERTHLSINSVKTYIRSAYRTMGVDSRSRAVLWGIDHGLAPERQRVAAPARESRPDDRKA